MVDRGIELRWGKTQDYKIGICLFSAKHAALKTGGLRIYPQTFVSVN